MPLKTLLETMTEEQIIAVVRKSKCKMLKGIGNVSREELIAHLYSCKCPVIKDLLQPIFF